MQLASLVAMPRGFTSPDGSRLSPLAYFFLLALCFACFIPGLATMPPTDRDESLFAQASKQMIETGNYTDIRVQDTPRYKKPIGIYWLQTASVRLFSPQALDEIWAYRLPSMLGATLAVLMTAALGVLLFSPTAGLVAALAMLSSVLLNVEARLATTDAALLAAILCAQYALARAYLKQATGWGMPLLFWTAVAAGILIKGPIVLLPVAGVLLWTRLADKTLSWFRALRPLPGLLYLLLLVSPWFIAIMAQSHGAFMQQSAGHDMLAKLWQGQNRGMIPPGAHLMALPILFFPFSLFVVLALPDMWRNRTDAAVKFCLGWAVPTWLVFELSMTKLPHYVLPAYPALALLAAKFLLDGLPSAANARRRFPITLVIGLWFIVGFALSFLFAISPASLGGAWSATQILAGLVMCASMGAAMLVLPRDKLASVAFLTAAALVFMAATFGSTVPNLKQIWLSRDIVAAAHEAASCPAPQLITTGYKEPSLIFLAGTNTQILPDVNEAAKALREASSDGPCRLALVDLRHKQAFLEAFAADPRKPEEVGTFAGINTGHGSEAALTLYRLGNAVAP